jgi:hypothetical protein
MKTKNLTGFFYNRLPPSCHVRITKKKEKLTLFCFFVVLLVEQNRDIFTTATNRSDKKLFYFFSPRSLFCCFSCRPAPRKTTKKEVDFIAVASK